MEIIKKSLEKRIAYNIGSIFVVFVIIMLLINYYKSVSTNQIDMSKKWKCSINGEKIKGNVDINDSLNNVEIGDVIEFTKKLDEEKEIVYPMIYGNFFGTDIKIYLNKEKIYDYVYVDSINGTKNCNVEIPEDYKNQQLKIKLKVKEKNKVFVQSIKMVDEKDALKTYILTGAYSILVSGTIIVAGIVIALIAALIKNKNKDVKRIFYIALLFVFTGMFLISRMDAFKFLFGEGSIVEIFTFSSIIGMIPCLFMIHIHMIENKKLINRFRIGFCIYILSVLIIFVLKEFVLYSLNIGMIFSAATVVGLFLLAKILLKEYADLDKIDKFFYKGMFVIYGLAIMEILMGLILPKYIFMNLYTVVITSAMLFLLIIAVVYYSFRINEYMDRITNEKILTTMAYTDPLTGIMNRTKYEEKIREIKEQNLKMYTFISFDLNNLKLINDKNGHDVGDKYIKTFSKVLRIGFGEEGFIARIGGDEFVAIIKNKYINTEEIIETMQELLKDMMKNDFYNEHVSFAYGCATSSNNRFVEIDKIIELADEKMYECKNKQKKEEISSR